MNEEKVEKETKQKPKLKCGGKCLKYMLVIINIIFFIFGLAIAGAAGYTVFDKTSLSYRVLSQHNIPLLNDGLYILFAVGLFLALLSFLGIWGAIAESRCILITYLVLIVIIFVIQLVGIIIAFVEFRKIEASVMEILSEPTPTGNTTKDVAARTLKIAIGAIEMKFKCCGVTGPGNYPANMIPVTCFPPSKNTSITTSNTDKVSYSVPYPNGCINSARPYLYAAGGIAIAVLILQIIIMLFTCCLLVDIKQGYEEIQ